MTKRTQKLVLEYEEIENELEILEAQKELTEDEEAKYTRLCNRSLEIARLLAD